MRTAARVYTRSSARRDSSLNATIFAMFYFLTLPLANLALSLSGANFYSHLNCASAFCSGHDHTAIHVEDLTCYVSSSWVGGEKRTKPATSSG